MIPGREWFLLPELFRRQLFCFLWNSLYGIPVRITIEKQTDRLKKSKKQTLFLLLPKIVTNILLCYNRVRMAYLNRNKAPECAEILL